MLRQCKRLRYHGNGEVIRREEFAQRKQAAEELQVARLNTKAKRLASAGKKFDGYPILQVHSTFACHATLSRQVGYSSMCMRSEPLGSRPKLVVNTGLYCH